MVCFNRKEFLAIAGKWKLEAKTISCLSWVKVHAAGGVVRIEYHGVKYQYFLETKNEGDQGQAEFVTEFLPLVTAIKASKEKTVTIELGEKSIKVDNFLSLPTQEGELYPEEDKVTDGVSFSIPGGEWEVLVDLVMPHISDDETRYFMNGIFFEHEAGDDHINIIATNGRTLAKKALYTPEMPTLGMVSVIVPVQNILHFADSDVEVTIGEKLATFMTGSEEGSFLISVVHLIEGQFPNYRRVIPEVSEKSIVLETGVFRSAMKKLVAIMPKRSECPRLVFTIGTGALGISYGDAKIEVPAKVPEGETGVQFAFNAIYLLDSLGDEDETRLNYSEATKAFRIDDSEVLRVIMPMQIA